MDKFEKLMREAVKDYEAPYNPAAWENVSNGLNKTAKPWKWMTLGVAAAAITGVTLVAVNLSGNTVEVNDVIADVNQIESNEFVGDPIDEREVLSTNIEENELLKESPAKEFPVEGNEIANAQNSEVETLATENREPSENEVTTVITNPDLKQDQYDKRQDLDGSAVDNSNAGNSTVEASTSETYYSITFDLASESVCADEKVIYEAPGDYRNAKYVWRFGDGTSKEGNRVEYAHEEAGYYDVVLELVDNKTDEILAVHTESIHVRSLPDADFKWEAKNNIIPSTKFVNVNDEENHYRWAIDGKVVSGDTDFEHTFRTKGTYDVALIAEDEDGCTNEVEHAVKIENDYNLYAPRAFSPNGDFLNDQFIPEALKIMDVEFVMSIFTERGVLLYQTSNISQPWDGLDNRGAAAPDGAYVWTVKFKNDAGQYETYSGQVFITR